MKQALTAAFVKKTDAQKRTNLDDLNQSLSRSDVTIESYRANACQYTSRNLPPTNTLQGKSFTNGTYDEYQQSQSSRGPPVAPKTTKAAANGAVFFAQHDEDGENVSSDDSDAAPAKELPTNPED